ncbi:30S ribosomal protein S2 [Candidatus Uhrbacteria bacterium RIFCSPHIGHO2_02_FULL_60_10]|uniref:Small ribosomal subunit protein uS2 n=1 Tax=Candidatus Uhrbacteria bacterium RIFCSPHIGHO2_02_FULL_60_10 TaxID=1802392 RepID=A0A1F7U2N6_9BACT|nr:MAG: 30S ribosomal protein S2 [Candidatus Uhrbacteria bacterium RIFCSPHIGHO2_02_FULL_60_10]
MPTLPSLTELLQAGVHFGHKESRWHPKMKDNIFGTRNGIHIIDLERTLARLKEALDFVRELTARGGNVLFLGSKRQARDIIKKYAEQCGAPYVYGRWLGGTLTNFGEVSALIKRFNDLTAQQAYGALQKYTKKEQSRFGKLIADMESKVGGVRTLVRPPDALFVIDVKKEKTAVAEAQVRKIPIIALADSNVNPDVIAYPIPSNDDAVKTIEIMTRLIAEAVSEGRALREQAAAAVREEKAKQPAAPVAPAKEASSK